MSFIKIIQVHERVRKIKTEFEKDPVYKFKDLPIDISSETQDEPKFKGGGGRFSFITSPYLYINLIL